MTSLAPILQGFFTDKLMRQKNASPHTISSYRDAWRLLLCYTQDATGTPPHKLRLAQLDHTLITGFLQHLRTDRNNSARTRNARLAAIHSLFRYAGLHAPGDAETIRRVLAIEGSRATTGDITWLTDDEITAVLNACDRDTWCGHRDHALICTLIATGLRVSELINLTRSDLRLRSAGSHVHCTGKGRKERCTPLDVATTTILKQWLDHTQGQDEDPLFPARGRARPLTRDAIQARLDKYLPAAARTCPSLTEKNLTAHVLRHTRAMSLRRAGNDISVIALWLGHAGITSTQPYLHADMATKEEALARTTPPQIPHGRYQPTDPILDFLENLASS